MPPPIRLEYFLAKISVKSKNSGSTSNSVPLVRRRRHASALQIDLPNGAINYNLYIFEHNYNSGFGKLL